MIKVFHHMYKVFCALMSIFIVVFDLKKLQGSEEDIKKAKYHLTFWLNSIGANASSHAPLVLLVGTHKDEVIGSCDLQKSNSELARTNDTIRQANEMIGDIVTSLPVYQSKRLKIHMPNQRELNPVLLFLCSDCLIAMILLYHPQLQVELSTSLLAGSMQWTTKVEIPASLPTQPIQSSLNCARH